MIAVMHRAPSLWARKIRAFATTTGALAVLALGLAACSSGPGAVSKMTDAAGNKPESVSCPETSRPRSGTRGATLRCELTDEGQTYGVTGTVTDVDAGDVLFDIKVDDQPE